MSEAAFSKAVKTIDEALKPEGEQGGFVFDKQKSLAELLKIFERKNLVAELKARAVKKGVKSSEWVTLVAQIDAMSIMERDIRVRFRTRVGGFKRRGTTQQFGRDSLATMERIIGQITK